MTISSDAMIHLGNVGRREFASVLTKTKVSQKEALQNHTAAPHKPPILVAGFNVERCNNIGILDFNRQHGF